jgi:alpha-1,3-rhamnosyl/mannosyltransferase
VIVGIDARVPVSRGRGWGRYTCEIIDALAATEQVELRILLPSAPLANELADRVRRRENVRVAFADFNPTSPDEYLKAAAGITPESLLGSVDLLHSPTRFILPTKIRPLVATVHDIAPLSDPPFKPEYRSATLRAIEFIRQNRASLIAVSEFTREELRVRGGLNVDGVAVIHNGVSDTFLENVEQADRNEDHYVLYVGGAGPNKNLERFVAAVRMLRETHQIDLVMAGDRSWDHAELRSALGATPPSWIRLSGYVSDQELARLYQNATVCVFPSLHEGFGLPVLEAMACGTPLACSRIAVLQELAGDTAAYFDPRSVEDIARVIGSVVGDEAHSSKLARRARERAREFTWKKAAQKTIGVYRSALQRDYDFQTSLKSGEP